MCGRPISNLSSAAEALWRLILLILVYAAGNLAAEHGAMAKERSRVALVIGNEAYAEAPVPNAVSDANAVADVLRQGGFDVVYVENAKKSDIADAIRNFAGKLEQEGVGAVYYSGHAVQYQNEIFWSRSIPGSHPRVPFDPKRSTWIFFSIL